jgi:hypothetical protein
MKFQYFTFFLNPVANLFEDKRNKIDILTEVLNMEKPLLYKSRGSQLAYVFNKQNNNYIVARLGRKSLIKRILPPNEQFEETKEENWPYCEVLFNLNKDPDKGQKIAFEYKSYIFSSPYEQLKIFADEINSHLMLTGYAISINPVTKEKKFWDLIKEHKGKIEKLSLSFNAPNLFGLKSSFNEELKEAQKEFNLTKTTVEFENPNGELLIPENAELVKQGVEYITKGGGEYSIKIKGHGRKVISSKNNIETKTFDFEELEVIAGTPELLEIVLKKIFE